MKNKEKKTTIQNKRDQQKWYNYIISLSLSIMQTVFPKQIESEIYRLKIVLKNFYKVYFNIFMSLRKVKLLVHKFK